MVNFQTLDYQEHKQEWQKHYSKNYQIQLTIQKQNNMNKIIGYILIAPLTIAAVVMYGYSLYQIYFNSNKGTKIIVTIFILAMIAFFIGMTLIIK